MAPTTVRGSAANHGGRTIPTFTDSFQFGGVTYSYTMVGTNPATDPRTTVVPTVLVPFRFVFPTGEVLSADQSVQAVKASPIYQPATFLSGTTQYGDAIQRAIDL